MLAGSSVRIFDDHAELSAAAADLLIELTGTALRKRNRFNLVLSGGGTPKPLYRLLAQAPRRTALPWPKTHVFWGDERCVPPDHEESNYGQAKRLLLDHVPIRASNVHRIKGELGSEGAAEDYRYRLAQMAEGDLEWPRPDVVLLGMGNDGHVASLFPGVPDPGEGSLAALAVTADYGGRPADRVTLTPRVFSSARSIIFLVIGAPKAPALAAVLEGPQDPTRWPVHRVLPGAGTATWLVDEEAASQLQSGIT